MFPKFKCCTFPFRSQLSRQLQTNSSNLPRIIAFSGRKQSGKSELCDLCVSFGYQCINFADELKNLVMSCLELSREQLERNKDTGNQQYYLMNHAAYIAKETNIDVDIIQQHVDTQFKSIREILQVIGTDIIRKYNPDWHIHRIQQKLDNNTMYCISDVRFPNEKRFVESLNGDCWYIIRPNNTNINNHSSETSLRWAQFRNIIVNDGDVASFKSRWTNVLMSYNNKNDSDSENDSYKFDHENLRAYSMLFVTPQNAFDAGYIASSGYLPESLKTNPYFLENLKFWNITCSQNDIVCNNVPFHIFTNEYKYSSQMPTISDSEIKKKWIMGLIIGQNKQFFNQQNSVSLYLPSSLIDDLQNFIPCKFTRFKNSIHFSFIESINLVVWLNGIHTKQL